MRLAGLGSPTGTKTAVNRVSSNRQRQSNRWAVPEVLTVLGVERFWTGSFGEAIHYLGQNTQRPEKH